MTVLCLPSDNFFAKRTEWTERRTKQVQGQCHGCGTMNSQCSFACFTNRCNKYVALVFSLNETKIQRIQGIL